MNILVTGANGQLGNEMRIVSKDSEDKYIFTDVVDASEESIAMLKKLAGNDINTDTTHLDITNLGAIREIVKENHVNVIVNCAAYTNVDAAEDHEELAELLNAKAPENLAIAMKEVNGLLVHISTDYVFGGDPYNTPCTEDQKGTPTGVYGLTKFHGEQNIRGLGCNYVIIRTSWLYSEFGNSFVKTILNHLAKKTLLKVVFDQVGTPTYAFDLANVIINIIYDYRIALSSLQCKCKNGSNNTQKSFDNCEVNMRKMTWTYSKNGVYHFSNEGVCSWFDFAMMISQYAGYYDLNIEPCHSNEYMSRVQRPSYSVLDKSKIKEAFTIINPYWVNSLSKCIKRMI